MDHSDGIKEIHLHCLNVVKNTELKFCNQFLMQFLEGIRKHAKVNAA